MKHLEITRLPTLPNIAEGVRKDAGSAAVTHRFVAQGLHEDPVRSPGSAIPVRDMIGLLERFARALRLHQGGSAYSLTMEGDKAVLSFRFVLPIMIGRVAAYLGYSDAAPT